MKPCRLLSMMVLLAVISVAGVGSARMYRPFSQDIFLDSPPSSDRYGGVIVVKFHNGSDIRAMPGRDRFFQSAAGGKNAGLDRLQAALVKAGAALPLPTFTRPVGELRMERVTAERNVGEEIPDLTLFFDIPVPDYRAAVALLEALRANDLVETAYARTIPVALPTPDLSTNQIYFGSALTNGYDVHYAWGKPGGSGSQAHLIDIEYDWTLDHEDLRINSTNLLWGDQYTNHGPDHGTASVGISGAISNGIGMTGIIHQGSIQTIGSTTSGYWVIANAINQAVAHTAPGDVILVEQQEWSDAFGNYCPVEIRADIYSAIANATALGRIVIEPAGNGGLDLDNAGWGGIFQRSVRDSGALMIGAGTCSNRSRCSFSCYGSRLDIQGWGDYSVATLAYGDLYGSAATNKYTRTFAGTSSASALSAAIAAAIQSYARVNYGSYLPPFLLRSNLVQSGYAQTFGPAGVIGPLPNLSNAFMAVDALAPIVPFDGLSAHGGYGGQCSPSNKVYVLTNAGPGAVTWAIANTQGWVTVAPAGVSLAPLASAQIVVSVNAAARSLAAGQYADTLVFSNVTSGVSQTRTVALTVTQANQAISFPAIPDQIVTSQVDLSASADSGLPVTFAVDSGPGDITAGTRLSFTGTGTVSIVASQTGDANWNAAVPVTRSLIVRASPIGGIRNADFDGDGKADPAIYDSSTGTWRVKLSSGNYFQVDVIGLLGGPDWMPAAADYDGDRLADPAVYQEATGNWSIKLTTAGYARVDLAGFLGGPGWAPCPADYDGDHKADPAVYKEVSGDWKIKLAANGYAEIDLNGLLGSPGYSAVPADFDGDGLADPAVYNRNDGAWKVLLSSAGYLALVLPSPLGGAGWDAVPGDYDGDRLADPAVRKVDGSEWRILLSGSGYYLVEVPLGL